MMVTVKTIKMTENPLIYLLIFFWIGMGYPLILPRIIWAGVAFDIFQRLNFLAQIRHLLHELFPSLMFIFHQGPP